MTDLQLIEVCRRMADLYVEASAERGRRVAILSAFPDDPVLREARFLAGMAEAEAWDRLIRHTNEVVRRVGVAEAVKIRRSAAERSTAAGVAAIRRTLLAAEAA